MGFGTMYPSVAAQRKNTWRARNLMPTVVGA
jgi:hypothetical protein